MTLLPKEPNAGWIWLDGAIVPWADATLPVLSHGLHYASAVFEGLGLYNGKIFKLTEHSERLKTSAEIMDFSIPYSIAEIDRACPEVARANKLQNGYVRPIAWRGGEQMGISAQRTKIHLAIAAWQGGSYFSHDLFENGIRLTAAPYRRPAPDSVPWAAKAAGLYMICTLSKHYAEAQGAHDALMLDHEGYVAEATGANIFMVKEGKLYTPIADSFLSGITRQTVIHLARQHSLEVYEQKISPADLQTADEIFLTGTAAEITAVGMIGDRQFPVGAITRLIREEYAALVRS